MIVEINDKYVKWLSSSDTGISSKTMFTALTGIPTGSNDIPYDIADVGRCIRMLRLYPELRENLQAVIDKHIEWIPFIDVWQELERLYDQCIQHEALPIEERKKIERRKHFISPNDKAWKLTQTLTYTARYLKGWRAQNNQNSFSNNPPQTF